MELKLERLIVRERAYIGVLSFEGQEAECFTLEDLPRDVKVARETCIPPGRYELRLRVFGRMYESYRRRFDWNEPGMLWLQAVPQFTDVLIHCGNTDQHTAGCLLLGNEANLHRPSLSGSSGAYERVYKRVSAALVLGERVWINIEEATRDPVRFRTR